MAGTPRPTFQEPLEVVCVDGEVVVIGPEHMHGSFSVEAAQLSAAILGEMVRQARDAVERQASAGDAPEANPPDPSGV
ncbi:MAG: hypothetical protein JWQ97_777 [Phenylobacterium sp.]|nr:hypothetical protein [Phenylobacterium sp.]